MNKTTAQLDPIVNPASTNYMVIDISVGGTIELKKVLLSYLKSEVFRPVFYDKADIAAMNAISNPVDGSFCDVASGINGNLERYVYFDSSWKKIYEDLQF